MTTPPSNQEELTASQARKTAEKPVETVETAEAPKAPEKAVKPRATRKR